MNRYRPNEPTSPVPLELLALLLRSEDGRIPELTAQLPERQRAALAVYCFSRAHMRALGLKIARDCAPSLLSAVGGSLGQIMIEQIASGEAFDVGPQHHGKKKVTLAKFAA